MREIKFRQYVWNDDSKTTGGRMQDWDELLSEEAESLSSIFTTKFSNASLLMQYTGLKDKNGKKIYEGDITKHLKHNTTVVWQWAEYYNCFFGVELDGTQRFYFAIDSVSLELIGNIHDNPELLEEEMK